MEASASQFVSVSFITNIFHEAGYANKKTIMKPFFTMSSATAAEVDCNAINKCWCQSGAGSSSCDSNDNSLCSVCCRSLNISSPGSVQLHKLCTIKTAIQYYAWCFFSFIPLFSFLSSGFSYTTFNYIFSVESVLSRPSSVETINCNSHQCTTTTNLFVVCCQLSYKQLCECFQETRAWVEWPRSSAPCHCVITTPPRAT